MIVESKLCAWLSAGLALYKAHPLMVEAVFYDVSQSGFPSVLGPGILQDAEKGWLPNEYVGGVLRWGAESFPIVSNTHDTLSVVGDPSVTVPVEPYAYQIVPPAVAGLTSFLQTETFSILSTFAQVPTGMTAFTVRLERDAQAEAYVGDSLEHYVSGDIAFDVRTQMLTGNYLISIWTQNREATLWLYSWLMCYALNSLPLFATWGLSDVAFSGSDLDPATQFLAERTYARHLLLTASRLERAVTIVTPGNVLTPGMGVPALEYVSEVCIRAAAAYAEFAAPLPQPLP
jgi:hypothetical protein